MDWVWQICEDYIRKYLRRLGFENPSHEQLQSAFIEIISDASVTILVQEPWQNAVRFKGLAKHQVSEVMPLIQDPENYLFDKYGGGKYKLNFHQGLNFMATKNFKPEGEPRWKELPDIGY